MALLPLAMWADEVNDTTYHYKDKQIRVEDDTLGLRVSVYDRQGDRLTKTAETTFIEGREVERVFVGSPFIPREELQNMDFMPHFPTIWFGASHLTQNVLGNRYDAIHARASKGFDAGVTTFAFAQPLDKANTFGVAAAVQVAYSRYCFQKDWLLQNTSPISFAAAAERAKGHYLDVARVKMPVVLQFSAVPDVGIALGLSPEWRVSDNYVWNPQKWSALRKISEGYDINTFGLNFIMTLGYGPLSMQAEMGLTPLFKTADGHKAYEASATIGIDVWTLTRMLKRKR